MKILSNRARSNANGRRPRATVGHVGQEARPGWPNLDFSNGPPGRGADANLRAAPQGGRGRVTGDKREQCQPPTRGNESTGRAQSGDESTSDTQLHLPNYAVASAGAFER